jgi:hypothetical protein
MITLAELEAASDALSASDKKELMLYLAARLEAHAAPHCDTPTLPGDWMAEDEAAMRRFHPNN